MRIRHSQLSRQDVREIGRYIRAHDPAAALKVRAEIQAALQLLASHPEAGRPIGQGLRRFAVPRLPYLIVYRVDEAADEVAIATIRHTARRPIV